MTTIRRYPTLASSAIVAAVIGIAEGANGFAWPRILVSVGIVLVYGLAVTAASRRSDTASLLAGRPRDERWEHINLEASTIAFGLTAIVVLAVFAFMEATGRDSLPYASIAGLMGLAYLGGIVFTRARH